MKLIPVFLSSGKEFSNFIFEGELHRPGAQANSSFLFITPYAHAQRLE